MMVCSCGLILSKWDKIPLGLFILDAQQTEGPALFRRFTKVQTIVVDHQIGCCSFLGPILSGLEAFGT